MATELKHPTRQELMIIGALVMAIALSWALPARGAQPQERVRTTLEAVTAVLHDPATRTSTQQAERQQQVRTIIYGAFDFREMAKETLGTQWPKVTPAQQDEFVSLFGTLFERSYNRMIVRFLGERQTLYGAESLDNKRAIVQTTLVSKNEAKLPVDYRLVSSEQRWAIADVVIDGVSLATNYRAQFAKILRTSSFETLMQRIKDKIDEERL